MRAIMLLLLSLSVARSFSIGRLISHFHDASTLAQIKVGHDSSNSATSNFRDATGLTSSTSSTAAEGDSSGKDTTKLGKFSKKMTNILNNIKAAPLTTAIAALVVGYKLGAKSVAKTSETASTATSSSARSAARQYPIVALLLFVVAVRDAWSLVPNWAKKNMPFVGSKELVEDADPDDLTTFPAISLKLRNLFQRGKEKLSSQDGDDIESPGFVFLALIRLMTLLKQQLAHRRDNNYSESGTEIANPKEVLEGMDEMFEFSDWAYNEFEEGDSLKDRLASKGYSLLRHEKTALPGHVAHYVAVSVERKEALIGIKGTSNFEDMLTDCCGNAVTHEFQDGPFLDGGREVISCHEGVLLSSKRLADDLITFVDKVLLPAGYKLKVVGHSLGAGVGVIFAMILRSRIDLLREDNGDKLKVLAFASPPILDYEASRNCKSFVTTFINNSDIVPRSSLSNLVLLMELMKMFDKRLDEEGLSPRGVTSTAKFLAMLAKGKHEDMIMNADEIQETIDHALSNIDIDDPEHLYVGGRVIHMYDQWTKEGYGNKSDFEDEADESKKVPTAEKVYASDGTAKALRIIEIDDRMMSDHMSAGYRASLRSLLDKSQEISPKSNKSDGTKEEHPESVEKLEQL